MARRKIALAFIVNNAARKVTFKKRKNGILKKLHELTTLCDIVACAIIYSPFDPQPEIWPADPVRVRQILTYFKGIPQMEQTKKMLNQETFLRQQIARVIDQLRKCMKENREKEMTQVMLQCLVGRSLKTLNMIGLNDLCWMIDQYLKNIQIRIDLLNNIARNKHPRLRTFVISQVSSSSAPADVGFQSIPEDQMSMTGSKTIIPNDIPITDSSEQQQQDQEP